MASSYLSRLLHIYGAYTHRHTYLPHVSSLLPTFCAFILNVTYCIVNVPLLHKLSFVFVQFLNFRAVNVSFPLLYLLYEYQLHITVYYILLSSCYKPQ